MTKIEIEKIRTDIAETATLICDCADHYMSLIFEGEILVQDLITKLEIIEKLKAENSNDENLQNSLRYEYEAREAKIISKTGIIKKFESELSLTDKSYWEKANREKEVRENVDRENQRQEIERRKRNEEIESRKNESVQSLLEEYNIHKYSIEENTISNLS